MEDKVVTFPLGFEKVEPRVDAVIVVMKTGETRNANISNKYFPEASKERPNSFKIRVLLKK